MSNNLQVLQADLRNATVKEITECMKKINEDLESHQKLVLSGKKEEVISRFASYIVSLLANNRRANVINLVKIVNEIAYRKLSWKFEGDQIKVNCQRVRRATTTTFDQINFVPSPFLKPIFRLSQIKICPVAGGGRQSKAFSFILSDANRQLLATPNACDDRAPYQIRFYCARYSSQTNNLLVEFPGVCELKVNDSVIQGHTLRCLKGKPGTVNPPDISIMTRKTAQNNIELIYINSDYPYIASAYIVERTPVATLIDIMKRERLLSKEKVLEKLQQIQEDADIIMESETLSTKCPLAFTRIVTPIRSKSCNHLQCFDGTTFLTMNEQTPTWSCPVCYRRIENWEDLIVDQYFTEMLQNTPKHIDSVRVEPNGTVTIIDENPDLANEESSDEEDPAPDVKEEPEVTILLDDDDDDTTNDNVNGQQQTNNIPNTSTTTTNTPDINDQQSQQPPRKKAKTSDVIDLTLESEEEDDDDDVQVSFSPQEQASKEATPQQEQITSNGIVEDDNSSSQQSTNETLILPHFGTLYSGGINSSNEQQQNNNSSSTNV